MAQLGQATTHLRLMLAEIRGREEELDAMIHQFRTQLDRLSRQAIYGKTTIDMALSAMADVEERLSHAQAVRHHLLAIKRRAADELSALELTRQVEEAKETLGKLKSSAAMPGRMDEAVAAEVRRLEEFIADYSKRAERAITSSFQEDAS